MFFSIKTGALLEIEEARRSLEITVAALAAERRNNDDLNDMTNALRKMRRNINSQERYVECAFQFHRAVVAATKNSVIEDICANLYRMLHVTLDAGHSILKRKAEDLKADLDEHHELLEKIREGDVKGATACAAKHMKMTRQSKAISELLKGSSGEKLEI